MYRPWHSQEHLIFDFQSFRLCTCGMIVFVGESSCEGETVLFVSRLTMLFMSSNSACAPSITTTTLVIVIRCVQAPYICGNTILNRRHGPT